MGFWDAIGALGDWLNAHLKDIFNVIGKVFATFVATFRAVIGVMGKVFAGHFKIFTSAARWITHAMVTLVRKWIPSLIHEVQSLYSKLRAWAKPLLDTIRRIRQMQQQYFDAYIKPLLNFIQHLRQALMILRLMHVKFATQLDQRLADLEGKLTARFLEVLKSLNLVSDYLNYILDPLGLVNSGLYLQTAIRSIGALFNALQDAQRFVVGAGDQAKNYADAHHYDYNATMARIAQRLVTGPTSEDRALVNANRAELEAKGYKSELWAAL